MEKLLEIIKKDQSAALSELAERLGMSEELMLAKLERYEQLGYVKRVRPDNAGCGKNCRKCRGCSGMVRSQSFTYWEKGERLRE